MKDIRSNGLRYALALGLFILTLGISFAVSYLSPKNNNLTIIVVAALVAVSWYGGRGPGILFSCLLLVATAMMNPVPPDMPIGKLVFSYLSIFLLLVFLVILISSRRQTESKLRAQRELLQVTLASIGDGVIATDATGAVSFLNPAAEALTGWKEYDALNQPLEKVFHIINEDTREEIENPFRQIKEEGAAVSLTNQTVLINKEGREIPVDESGAPIKDQDGNVIGAIIVFHDVTRRRMAEQALIKSEERLMQSQKMEAIGVLTGGVAHDFNNLLTAILGNTQLALRRLKADDPLQNPLIEVEKAGNRAAVLTRQLLVFSRRQHLDRKNIDLNEAIGEILKLLGRIIGEDVKVTTKFAADLETAYADRGQIEQVIMNLSVNARDAMPEGGELCIETENIEFDEYSSRQYPDFKPGKYVQIKVSDSGCGMDDATQSRIFEPFFTTKSADQGTGLGLSMVYGIVKQHEGLITVYSEPGHGTTFKIFLPAVQMQPEKEKESVQPSLPGGMETILVAEDEEILRNLSRDILEALGYKVIMVENGAKAVEAFEQKEEAIDLLLFDVIMPSVGGVEAYERIHKIDKKVPVVFMTGYSPETTYNRIEQYSNAFDHAKISIIQKPYNFDGLGRAVREGLDGMG